MNLTPSISAFPDPEFVQFFVVPAVHRYQKDVLKSSRWCNGGLAGHLPHRRGVTKPSGADLEWVELVAATWGLVLLASFTHSVLRWHLCTPSAYGRAISGLVASVVPPT
jgi:hypothetical protein